VQRIIIKDISVFFVKRHNIIRF